ncbi:MAG: hypothetical protein QME66_01770 [Candidatus Eisenbacteria bacterium]|nr:hypothetical protein [Candidatus Eisenbacteria bacterium]
MKRGVGIAVDGTEIRSAHLVKVNKVFKVLSLSKGNLLTKLDVAEDVTKDKEEVSLKEIFGGTELGETKPKVEAEDNSSVLLRMLGEATSKGSLLALNLSESNVLFYEIDPSRFGKNAAKLSKKSVMKKLRAELERKGESQAKLSELDCFRTDRGSIIGLAYDPPGELLALISTVKSFVSAKFRVSTVDSNMIALMNLVRADTPDRDQVQAVVYIGKEFSRVLFLKGGDYLRSSRVINEGADSPQILETVHSRIIFEQDEAGITEVNRVVLAGDVVRLGGKDFLAPRFPNASVEYLVPPQLDLSSLSEEEKGTVCEYAIPLGLAWKALEPGHPGFYLTNLLPAQVIEMEKLIKITWYHIAIIALFVLAAFFLAGKDIQISSAMNSRRANISYLDRQIAKAKPLLVEVDQNEARLVSLGKALGQLNALEKSTPRWTTMFSRMARGTSDLGGLWLTEFGTTEKGILLVGRSVYRNRVSSFSKYLDKPKLGEVRRATIRQKEIYSFTYEAEGSGGKK